MAGVFWYLSTSLQWHTTKSHLLMLPRVPQSIQTHESLVDHSHSKHPILESRWEDNLWVLLLLLSFCSRLGPFDLELLEILLSMPHLPIRHAGIMDTLTVNINSVYINSVGPNSSSQPFRASVFTYRVISTVPFLYIVRISSCFRIKWRSHPM